MSALPGDAWVEGDGEVEVLVVRNPRTRGLKAHTTQGVASACIHELAAFALAETTETLLAAAEQRTPEGYEAVLILAVN